MIRKGTSSCGYVASSRSVCGPATRCNLSASPATMAARCACVKSGLTAAFAAPAPNPVVDGNHWTGHADPE